MQSRGSLDSIYQTENVSKFKIVVLGDQGVGKSALVWKFIYSGFEDKYQPTIGIDFFTKTLYLSKCQRHLVIIRPVSGLIPGQGLWWGWGEALVTCKMCERAIQTV